MNHDGYVWIETTTPAELNAGQRTFIRGMPKNPEVEPWIDNVRIPGRPPNQAWLSAPQPGEKVGMLNWVATDIDMSKSGWRRIYIEKRPAGS